MENPTTFRDAQLCDADFRETSFVKADMSRADMTKARMYGASILDSEGMGWKKTTWWRADYDQADWTASDPNALRNTRESLELLSTSYRDDLPANLDELDQSVRKFIESTQRKALWSERARATLFACPDVVVSAVPMNPTAVVQGLAGGADIAIVFRFVGETLGAKEWAPLSVDTVTGPHVGSDAPIG